MAIEKCQRPGCTGIIVDGVCEDCGRPPIGKSLLNNINQGQTGMGGTVNRNTLTTGSARTGSRRTSSRSGRTSAASSRRNKLGGGLVSLPEQPSQDPLQLVMEKGEVPERKRFCPNCQCKVNRTKGFCPKCGHDYDFQPALKNGDIVNGKFEIKGPIAFGGLGWIYLAYDTVLSRWVVLKGLLNAKDEASAAAAVAERQFLAAVKHPKIVGIYDFIQRGNEGFIVMEYVGGRTIQSIRKERGVLPLEEAISYILGILPAFSYLHQQGMVYCDFKPDNMMLEGDDVKLVDMGGVRKLNDPDGDIFGTKGYMAPEAADNPLEVSDLYTIGRTLAVLIMDFKFQSDYEFSIPSPLEQPVLAENDALYRFLLRATHQDIDARFQSADEMYSQLFGVLREVVAVKSVPIPAESQVFTPDNLLDAEDALGTETVQVRHLPTLKMDARDPAANDLLGIAAVTDTGKRITSLMLIVNKYQENSVEARLRLADIYIQVGKFEEADRILDTIFSEDEFDWRVHWYRGKKLLAQDKGEKAMEQFEQVYFEMPGELTPKLAIAYCAEHSGELDIAVSFYNRVSKVDPNNTTACFGLSRCLRIKNDITGSAAALDRVPASHSMYMQSRIAVAKVLMSDENAITQMILDKLAQTVGSISSGGGIVHQLAAGVY
ncbi:MAG: tetratricopeptide repeat protein, partial [Bacillota bacterium]|nr:tetratricopeptide repeat protein [Bacillota bacterium]